MEGGDADVECPLKVGHPAVDAALVDIIRTNAKDSNRERLKHHYKMQAYNISQSFNNFYSGLSVTKVPIVRITRAEKFSTCTGNRKSSVTDS